MSKTAIQELIKSFDLPINNHDAFAKSTILYMLHSALAKEREQIEEAYVRGHFDHEHVLKNDGLDQTSADYYEEMFGNELEESK